MKMVKPSNENLEQIFLTSSQAADLLNVSLATLKKYISLGKIRTIKTPGGHYRIKKQDLLENLYHSVD
jgi:excisionase family DNA binding protein